ncbi:CheR family methyltransferase [Hymenobacter canadensis]|uniref:protein-glutamate O-methyltransferase n=1 Tax=Hymenobacter canadensis TaxID=2999067 RepID=A0ABY7LSN3_9BACT|nr:CheR family methyltransferase [Hymenobacter canadensis]WBA43415.1 PAS domain-containing protein [Hymenobacter canadensis]
MQTPKAPVIGQTATSAAAVTPVAGGRLQVQPGPLAVGLAGSSSSFPIVCLGGSAGSLVALEHFLRAVQPTSGLAYIVVTHQMPTQDSELAHVLQHFTSLPVHEVTDGLKVRPNHVYVIPPGRDMSLLHGSLHLFEFTQARGHRLPIDYFLQSLAKDARDRAVCIILSGMGADGSIGLKMVMENFGMVMVQDPQEAEFDSMPRAAIATEFVDFVLPAADMPARLLEYVRQPPLRRPLRSSSFETLGGMPAHALQKIFILIRNQTGHDFSFYKRNTVFRRIERRMNGHQIREFTHYVRYLQHNPEEVEHLFKELLIGVTKFFRDPEAFASLKRQLLLMLRQLAPGTTVRVWAPGCSTGEEAYSLAMTLLECFEEIPGHSLRLQLFATDISTEGVETARAGVYTSNIEADVSPERLRRFFIRLDGAYQICKEVRDSVVFALHNLNKDAPFTKLDLLCCRNLLIYLSAELQKNLLPIFHYALNPNGLLFLGPSENLTGFQDLFAPLDVKWKISRRSEGSASLVRLANFPFTSGPQAPAALPANSLAMIPATPRRDGMFASLVQRAMLGAFAPPSVVVNTKGDILFVHGRTGKYLEPAPGLSGMNILDMARDELRFEISDAMHRASHEQQPVVSEGLRLQTEAGYQLLRLRVQYLAEPELLAGLLLVSFEDMPTPRRVRHGKPTTDEATRTDLVAALDKELQYTRHRLQTTIEEMESSLEELKSTNEELQSANEELQSTNEEAMTNKEEMQSLNEELMTLNMQYLSKTEELSLAANDMKNLLDATEIATIFLDNDMLIKRFTPPVSRIIALMPADVGRPITHFASTLRSENLAATVQQVLDRLISTEATIQTTSGDWYAMRILPYRTFENYISGAVITFTDVTAMKQLEERVQVSRRLAESIVETVREPLVVLDEQLRILTVSQAFATTFGVDAAAAKGQELRLLSNGAWQQPALHQQLARLLDGTAEGFDDFGLDVSFPGAGRQSVLLYGRRILSEGQPTGHVLLGLQSRP